MSAAAVTDSGDRASTRPRSRSSDIAFVIVAFLAGFAVWPMFAVLGSLFDTLNSQFGWSRAQVTTAQLIFTIASVAAAPVVGPLIDRVGARALLLLGLILFPLALIVVGSVDRSYGHWMGAWILASLAGQFAAPSVVAAGVARRFSNHRGIALGIAACGVAAATAINPMIMVKLIALGTWRYFYYGMAVFLLFILLPLAYFFYRDTHRSVDHDATPGGFDHEESGRFGRDVLGSRQFWQLLLIISFVSFIVGGMLIHMLPLFISHGLSAASAAAALAFYGIGGVAARLIGGWLLDRFDTGPLPALPMCVLPVIACLIVIFAESSGPSTYGLVAFLIGVSAGVEVDVLPYLVRRYFSKGLFGRAYISLSAVFVGGAGGAPFLVSLLYDATRSYEDFLIACVVMGCAATVLLLMLGPYPSSDGPVEPFKRSEREL